MAKNEGFNISSNLRLGLIIFLICLSKPNVIWANFGESCTNPQAILDYNSLKNDNVYGYVQNLIDMKLYVPSNLGCNSVGQNITICLKTPLTQNLTPPCEMITFNANDQKNLFAPSATWPANHPLKDVVFTSKIINQDICITMPTSKGQATLACKAINPNNTTPVVSTGYDCKISKSCYAPDSDYSKSLFNFSGKSIHCIKETLDLILIPEEKCLQASSHFLIAVNPFSSFQGGLKNAVRGALVLYLIFFGIRIMLNPYKLELNEIFLSVLKVILVLYFSVGIGSINYKGGIAKPNDGTTQVILPILTQVMSDFSMMVFNSSSDQNFCKYSPGEYPAGYGFYAVWDSIDCRLSSYLGGESFTNGNGSIKSAVKAGVFESDKAFSIFTLIFRMLIGGEIALLIFTLIFVIILLSVTLFILSSYLVCLISIYVMCYLAPIFIPMALFERTQGYFESWVKNLISFALQPFVLVGFLALMINFYDSAIYGKCEFNKEVIEGISFFNIKDSTEIAPADQPSCEESLGYKLHKIFFDEENIADNTILFLKIFTYNEVENRLTLTLSMLYLTFLSIIFYYFSAIISQFASDITGGTHISSVIISPQELFNKIKDKSAMGAKKLAAMKSTPSRPKPKDKSGAEDKVGMGE